MSAAYTSTRRAAGRVRSPCRARLYARCPSTLTAEKAGGSCLIRPTKRLNAAATCSAWMSPAGATASGSLSASSVAVLKPRWTSASYVFGRRRANSASRVADSNRMGSTPVASGSSVPAWPTRLARVAVRSWETTENEVAPAGLSTFRTPARIRSSSAHRCGLDRFAGQLEHHGDRIVERIGELGAGRAQVATSAEPATQLGRVHCAPGAHADLGEPGADLLEDDRDLYSSEAAQRVDDVLGLRHDGARLMQHAATQPGPCQLPVHLDLHAGDRQAAQLDRRQWSRLVDHERHVARVSAESRQPRRIVQCSGGGVLVAKASRVGHKCGVEVRRHRR